MADRAHRVVRFVTAQLEHFPKDRCRARVILDRPGHDLYIGTAERTLAEVDDLRCAAEAAAAALRQAVAPEDPEALHIQGVERFDVSGSEGVLVAVDARRNNETRRLTGVCDIDGDPARAAALAVLQATNRFLWEREPTLGGAGTRTSGRAGTRTSKAAPRIRPQAFSFKEASAIRKSILTSGGRPTCPRCGADLVLHAQAPDAGRPVPAWELRCESCHRSLAVPGFPNQDGLP